MPVNKSKTQGKGTEGGPGDIYLRGAMQTGIQAEDYMEKPRPSLYNVVKKLKEQTNETVNRLCYISKVNENVFKGDFSNELKNWTTNVVNNDEDKEFDPKQGEPVLYGGFAVVLGPWVVHLFEAEQPLMGRYIKKLYEKSKAKDSYYTGIWIMHYTEDVAQKAYNNQWSCQSINTKDAVKTITEMNAYGRVSHIYNSMVSIGVNAHAKTSGGGKSAGITQEMKSLAQEHIPCGEQLKSAISEETFTI